MQTLTLPEREYLEYSLRIKRSRRTIARLLHRDLSSIKRELRRNTLPGKRYDAAIAQRRADQRARKTNTRKLDADDDLRAYVVTQLREGWSPEEVCGRLRTHAPKVLRGRTLCHETVYQWIYEGEGRFGDLYAALPRQRPKRRRRRGRTPQKIVIPQRISIHARPETINARKRVGDWESDTMVFRKQSAGLSVQYERKCQLTRFHRIRDRSAAETEQAIAKTIDTLPEWIFKSMTFDNGGEGACHVQIRERLAGLETYFCDAYASWQKGGVENTNGLIRRYLPSTTKLATVSDDELKMIEERLNNRPRKSLGYRTPNECLREALGGTPGALNSRTRRPSMRCSDGSIFCFGTCLRAFVNVTRRLRICGCRSASLRYAIMSGTFARLAGAYFRLSSMPNQLPVWRSR